MWYVVTKSDGRKVTEGQKTRAEAVQLAYAVRDQYPPFSLEVKKISGKSA